MLALLTILAGCLAWAGYRAFVRWNESATREMLADFEKHFPGRCPICSFARYGRQIGVDDAWPPKAHDCPDAIRALPVPEDKR